MQFFNSFSESARSVGLSLTLSDLSYFKCFFCFFKLVSFESPTLLLVCLFKVPIIKAFFLHSVYLVLSGTV